MTAPDDPPGVDRGRLAAGAFVIAVLLVLTGLLLYYLLRPDPNGSAAQPLPTPAPTAQPAPSEPLNTPTPAAPPTPTEPAGPFDPTELPTGDLEPGTTAIFRGQPATGPWQNIGSVREITAEGAGPVADYSYRPHWRDQGLSDATWDLLVARVSLQAVELGPPLERPVMNAVGGSEKLNARGGLRWADDETGGRGHLVAFDAIYDDDGLAVWPRWAFLIDPATEAVLAEAPRFEVSESDADTFEEATDQLADLVWEWVVTQPVRG